MSDLQPILIIRASEISPLSTHASVAEADKYAVTHGVGSYVVVRVVHPIEVPEPKPAELRAVVGEGFIKKPNARGPRKPKTIARNEPPLEVDDTDVGTA